MTKRLFVAIPLPQSYLDILSQYGSNYNLPGINWTKQENLHITVHFFGEIKTEKIPQLISALKEVANQIDSFKLNFNKIIFGPPTRIPMMVWAIFHGHNHFQKLAVLIYQSTKDFLFEIQEPKFLPHITLARFKGFVDVNKIKLEPVKLNDLKVESFCLMESELSSKGPIYIKLADFKLNFYPAHGRG